MRAGSTLGWGVALALVSLSSSPVAATRPVARLAHARALVRGAIVLESSAIELVHAHNGGAAVEKIQLAEADMRQASGAIAKASLDYLDVQSIATQLSSAVQLDEQALRGPPDRAVSQLRLAGSFKRRALTLMRQLADDGGGGIPA